MIRIASIILLLALPAAAAADDGARFGDRFTGDRDVTVAAVGRPLAALKKIDDDTERPALKASAIIAGEIVRIGDLVDNAGAVANVAIFRAPDLGQTGTVPAASVIEAVRSHHIIGLDTRGIAEVVVTRESRTLTAKDFEARIISALAGQSGLTDAKNLAVAFDNQVRTLQVETTATGDLRVARLSFEPRSGRFDVTFELPGSAVARRLPMRFTGAIAETFEAVTVTRPVAQGEILSAADLTIARRPKSEFTTAVIINADRAVTLAAKHSLRPGQAIRQTDLVKPEVVARNESVMISYAVPGVVVTTRGQALEPGAAGDVINVLNVQSKKTIQATVTGPGRVSVASTAPRLANAAITNAR